MVAAVDNDDDGGGGHARPWGGKAEEREGEREPESEGGGSRVVSVALGESLGGMKQAGRRRGALARARCLASAYWQRLKTTASARWAGPKLGCQVAAPGRARSILSLVS